VFLLLQKNKYVLMIKCVIIRITTTIMINNER